MALCALGSIVPPAWSASLASPLAPVAPTSTRAVAGALGAGALGAGALGAGALGAGAMAARALGASALGAGPAAWATAPGPASRPRPASDDELEALARKLGDEDARKRRTAVKALAELGTPEAWELVLSALRDEEPEVADQAQLELARVEGDEAVERLHGRDGLGSRDAGVRARVAEALGRSVRRVACPELLAAVSDRESEVRRLGWWSVERLALADRVGATDRDDLLRAAARAAGSERDPAVGGAALVALAALDPAQGLERALEALRPREELALRCAAALACAVASRADAASAAAARTAVRDAALDPEAPQALRLAAIDALERLARGASGGREALAASVELLEAELAPREAAALVGALRAATGLGLGRRAAPWRAAVEALPEDWTAREGARDGAAEGSVARLAGLPLLSDRLAVLIDMSGSIWQTRADGQTLKQLVDRELRLFLEALPPGTRFNLIPYATEPVAWEDRLVAATPRNVGRALEWFEESRLRGRGAVWEAIELALEDEETDTLIVLTDGAPTGGRHWNLDLMVPLLLERNRYRRVAFDSILTDPRPALQRHWTRLAEGSAGLSIDVRFSDG